MIQKAAQKCDRQVPSGIVRLARGRLLARFHGPVKGAQSETLIDPEPPLCKLPRGVAGIVSVAEVVVEYPTLPGPVVGTQQIA